MPLRKLIHLVIQNIARSKKNFIFSSIGIIVGISALTFFVALSEGIRERVVNRIYPIDQLEVEPIGGASTNPEDDAEDSGFAGALMGHSRALNATAIQQLKNTEDVAEVFPKMRARFPAKVETGIIDRRMAAEGFLEGLYPNPSVSNEMKMYEESCSTVEEDMCRRREISCKSDSECPHEGMECASDGMCRPRRYWQSFVDKSKPQSCTTNTDCVDGTFEGQVCAYDRWIILKGANRRDIKPLRVALDALHHDQLDIEMYLAVAETGAIDYQDVLEADRAGAEVWTIQSVLTQQAQEAVDEWNVVHRAFASVKEAVSHVQALSGTLREGVCRGAQCSLDEPEAKLSHWVYSQMYENHISGDCPVSQYCATHNVLTRAGRCEPYMPVAINPLMLDFYNANVVSQLDTQPLSNECLVLGLKGYLWLGFSFLRESQPKRWQRLRWAEIVGFSNKAMHLGGTVPLGYVERFNQFYLGSKATEYYDTALLNIPRNEDVANVIERVQKQGYELSTGSRDAQKAAQMMLLVTLTFLLISLIIIIISAMNISHTFLMVIYERQREIGIMRAIGASKWDIRTIILGESCCIGLVAGILGNGLSYGISRLVNGLADGLRERFPVIPDDFFIYDWTLIVGSVAFALCFCLIGAWVPANRAAKLDPAVVLTRA
jgi:ABC-type lipoprotein release transport system permease subunit